MASDCKVVTVRGKRRRLCWGTRKIGAHMQRVIISNKPASGGATKRKSSKRRSTKRKSTKKAGVWRTVARKNAIRKSGKFKGRLKKGCKFTKSGAKCKS